MRGGLEKHSRYLLAGASIIGLLAANLSEAKAQTQDLQQIQAQIQEMQATIQALQKQVQVRSRRPPPRLPPRPMLAVATST